MHGKYLVARGMRSGSCRSRGEFLGMDADAMSRGAKVGASLSVIVPVALSGVFLFAFLPDLWWILTIYGWVAFPAFGLLAKGLSQTSGTKPASASAASPERELLEALRRRGELTPARAAMETSLSVAEADKMLGKLAGDGHLEVRARDGGVFYALWRSERDES